MRPKALILNGPSSSGKSTLAGRLKVWFSERGEDVAVISIDDYMKIPEGETIYEDDVYEIADALGQAIREVLASGRSVIVDHVITSERVYLALTDALSGWERVLVRVTCPLEELRRREAARGNRHPGSAETSLAYLYPREGYDLTIDTFSESFEECAEKIGALWLPGSEEILCRAARPADGARIDALFREMIGSIYGDENASGYEENYLLRFFGELGDRIFVAEDRGEVVAFLSVEEHHDEQGDYFYLDDFSVTAAYRGRGIGTKLLRLAEDYAAERGIRVLTLHAEKSNFRAKALYERMGYAPFRDDGERELYLKELG